MSESVDSFVILRSFHMMLINQTGFCIDLKGFKKFDCMTPSWNISVWKYNQTKLKISVAW
jgi:hypothetical protein